MDYKKTVREWLGPIMVAIIAVVLIDKFLFFQIKIPSESMYPTIKIGDRIMVTRVYDRSKLKRGDIVVFYSRELNESLIKRLVALPGDEVEIRDKGQVYVNGKKSDEPYVVYNEEVEMKFKVPENQYLFFGDNRANSRDSRKWRNPCIDGKDIKGKARFITFPFRRAGKFVVGKDALDH